MEGGVEANKEAPIDEKALAKIPEIAEKKNPEGSIERDLALAKLEDDKRCSVIKAWEDNEKSKVNNRSEKKIAEVGTWENTKKAALEAQLKKIEENLEKKKATYAERVKNKVALVHQQAEEKRAAVAAKRGEEILKTEESVAKFRATRTVPKKTFGCF